MLLCFKNIFWNVSSFTRGMTLGNLCNFSQSAFGVIYSQVQDNFNSYFNECKHNNNSKFIFYLYSTKAQGNFINSESFSATIVIQQSLR